MKNWKKKFNIVAIVVIIFSFAYVLFLLEAKDIITKAIQQASGRKTMIAKLNIKPPLNLEIRGLEIEGLLKANYIYISPSIPNLLTGRVALNKVRIMSPEIFYQRTATVESIQDSRATVMGSTSVTAPANVTDVPGNKGLPVTLKSLKVYSGRLNFIDTTSASGPINFIVEDIKFYFTNLSTHSADAISNFSLTGNISWNSGEPDGRISLQGWVDFHKKNMLANLKIEDIDAIVFHPYYSTWVDLEKARIEKAKLNFSSDIKGENNNVSAVCRLELVDIVRKVRPNDQQQLKAEMLTDAVLEMFKTMDQGKVVLNFTLNTRMDRPIFGFGDIKSAFEGKLMQGRTNAGLRPQDMLLWPFKLLQSGFRSGANLSNAAIDGVFALGDGIKKFFEEAVDRQPVPAQ